MYIEKQKKKYDKKYLNPFTKYVKNLDLVSRRIRQNKVRLLDSGYTEGQAWYGLGKAWKGFKISRSKGDTENEEKYAVIIQRLEQDLKLDISHFEILEMPTDSLCKACLNQDNKKNYGIREKTKLQDYLDCDDTVDCNENYPGFEEMDGKYARKYKRHMNEWGYSDAELYDEYGNRIYQD